MSNNPQNQKKTKALARIPPQHLEAASRTIHALTELFGENEYHLLVPLFHMALPRGTKLAITEVRIDTEVDKWGRGNDLVRIAGDQHLIRKHKLDQIATAAGIGWTEEKRADGAKHPHYFEMHVKGKMTCFDGSVLPLTGHKVIDLRENIPGAPGVHGKDWEEMVAKNKNPDKQIMEGRKFGAEICASKAKNRAIASALGIRRSYTLEELDKPFVMVKPVPDSDDTNARELIMANAAGATDALYGSKKKPEVIDVPFEETSQPAEADVESAHDPETGEVIEEKQDRSHLDLLIKAWGLAQADGMKGSDFKILCESNTGKTRKEDMTVEDAQKVLGAVTARIANAKAGEEDLPV